MPVELPNCALNSLFVGFQTIPWKPDEDGVEGPKKRTSLLWSAAEEDGPEYVKLLSPDDAVMPDVVRSIVVVFELDPPLGVKATETPQTRRNSDS
jgi:hypothetical protein